MNHASLAAIPFIFRFHLPATLKPKKPPVFVTLTPLRKKDTRLF
jgi:hypothetical protein